MTINFNGTDGLFPILRALLGTIEEIQAAQGTDVPTKWDTTLAALSSLLEQTDTATIANDAARSVQSWKRETGTAQSLKSLAESVIQRYVLDDQPARAETADAALTELIRQMVAEAESVIENDADATPSQTDADAPTLLASNIGADGKILERMVPEVFRGLPNGTSGIVLESPPTTSALAADWPQGSGTRASVQLATAANALLANGSFDTETARPNSPDGWLVPIGDIGTTLMLTHTEVQSVEITGTPTSGTYTLKFTNLNGDVQITTPLAYNAGGGAVEAALAALTGLSGVSVTTSGTVPNYTHTVAFNSVSPAGDQPLLVEANDFDTGGITITEETAGSVNSLNYRALAMIGTGSELTTIQQRLRNPTAQAVLAFGIQMKRSASATGVLQVRLIDGPGNTLEDDSGVEQKFSVNINSETNSSTFTQLTSFFRLPSVLPSIISIQIRLTTAINSAQGLYLDDAILVTATQTYDGGPLVALLANKRDLLADDEYTLTVTNDHAGRLQTWFGRLFGVQLPSAASGDETIADV